MSTHSAEQIGSCFHVSPDIKHFVIWPKIRVALVFVAVLCHANVSKGGAASGTRSQMGPGHRPVSFPFTAIPSQAISVVGESVEQDNGSVLNQANHLTESPFMSSDATPVSDDDFIPDSIDSSSSGLQPLRVWPAVLLLLVMLACRMVVWFVNDGPPMFWMVSSFGPLVCSVLMLSWWVTFSRSSGLERLIGCVGVLSALGITIMSLHFTMQGPGMGLLTVPLGMMLFGVTAIGVHRMLSINRTFIIVVITAAGFGSTLLLQSDGMRSDFTMEYAWRWSHSTEEQLLADSPGRQGTGMGEFAAADVDAWLRDPEWPAFRGPGGAAQQDGTMISSDWSSNPPQELWKITVGSGWSSFAVAGELLFTQEQRNEAETVVCYAANSGKEIWTQQVESRFWDPLGGPGPRATPTLAGDGLFVQGATGLMLKLDPRTGDIHWQEDLRELAKRDPLEWGFSSSPLVVGNQCVVYGGGDGDLGIFGLDAETGQQEWSAPTGNHSYSSPALLELLGAQYIAMLTNDGITLIEPQTGAVILDYEWPYIGYRAVQPRAINGDSILVPTGNGAGTRCIQVTATDHGLAAKELWTSQRLKPDFNDFVIHDGYAYGFDNKIISCIDLRDGKPKWKGGRYGKGQLMLLADSDFLLVMGESGEVVLLQASPAGHQELAKLQAFADKTWNHPVVVGDRLFIRNSKEASCWKLPVLNSQTQAAAAKTGGAVFH
jgi:outer membrane protein assembly factor BamB